MRKHNVATTLCLIVALATVTWGIASGNGTQPTNAEDTYTPTIEEWLQVYLNSNFSRHDAQRMIGFVVMPGQKKISMMAHIYEGHPREAQDPGHKTKLRMEADGFEAQAKAYAKRFGFELERQKMPGS